MMAIDSLIGQLTSSDEIQRREAIDDLAKIGSEAIAPLIDALDDPKPLLRGSAALALGQLSEHAESERALPKLGTMLGDESDFAQKCAADALVQFDDWAEAVLVEAITDRENPDRQGWAAYAMYHLARPIRAAIAPLVELLMHDDLFVRSQSARAIVHVANCPVELTLSFGNSFEERLRTNNAVELLIELLQVATKHKAVEFAEALTRSLRETGDDSDEAYRAFFKAVWFGLRERNSALGNLALDAIEAINPGSVMRNRKSVTIKGIVDF